MRTYTIHWNFVHWIWCHDECNQCIIDIVVVYVEIRTRFHELKIDLHVFFLCSNFVINSSSMISSDYLITRLNWNNPLFFFRLNSEYSRFGIYTAFPRGWLHSNSIYGDNLINIITFTKIAHYHSTSIANKPCFFLWGSAMYNASGL